MTSGGERVALVTGATSGIGRIVARELAGRGFRVLLHGRNPVRVSAAVAEVQAATGGRVEGLVADFASLAEVRSLADEARRRTDRLHILVNNAGGAAMRRTLSPDGIEQTLAVNQLAPFLLTSLLLDLVRRSAPARIVNVASEAHRMGPFPFDDPQNQRRYRGLKVYGQTKLANVLFTMELARRLTGSGVTVNAVHPGTVDTSIWNAARGPGRALIRLFQLFMLSPERGAAPVVRLAADGAMEGVTGAYF